MDEGAVVLDKSRVELEPRFDAFPTLDELRGRLDDPTLALLDVRHPEEFAGQAGAPCDPRQGHIPGARNVEVSTLFSGPGQPRPAEDVKALAGLPDDADVVTYCHSGSRSALAMIALRAAGYRARNYVGSWHEWSRHEELPVRALGGNRDSLGGLDEVAAERSPERFPAVRLPIELGEHLFRRARNLLWLAREPLLEDLARDLRVELHAPGHVAQPERLRAPVAPREHLGAARRRKLVVVPLEGREAFR